MRKIQKFLMLLLFVCLSVTIMPAAKSNAEETPGEQAAASSGLKDENPQRLEEVTGMDENGNIYTVDEKAEETAADETEAGEGGAVAFRAARASSVKVVNFRTKGNATTSYKEYGTGEAGYTNGAFGADAAYLGTSNGKVKFMLSGVVGEVKASEVKVVDKSSVAVVSCYVVEDGRLIHKVAHDITTPGWASKLDNGAAPSYLKGGKTYYSYDGHYFYTDYAKMLADYQKNTRSNSVNPKNPYYNYYQYLPLRSKTNYSGSTLKSMINKQKQVTSSSKMYNTGSYFVDYQNAYGVNALIMTGIAANESGWGTSNISKTKNNLFGLNAVDTSPGTSATKFASVKECIRQFAEHYMSSQYLYPKNGTYNGGFLGNKASGINVKYASDPYWGERAANIIYTLDKNNGKKDYNTYTIGIKDTISTQHTNINIRNGSSTSSKVLYQSGEPSNYAVIVQNKKQENGFYRIQSDGVLNSGRTAITNSTGKYSYDKMYAYVSGDYITLVNSGQNTTPAPEPTPKKTLQSISISKAPTKTVYTEGEKFSPSGMKVMAKWSDGSQTDVTSKVTYSTAALKKGTSDITISYASEGVKKTVKQKITVNAKKPDAGTTAKKYTKYKTTTRVNYRTGAGTNYSIKGTLATGKQINVENGYSKKASGYTWYRFKMDGKEYYLASKYVTKVSSGSSTGSTSGKKYTKYKTTTRVNYRTGAGTSHTIKGTLATGKQIEVEDGYSKKANGYTWYRFKMNGKEYYLASKYVTKVSSGSSAGSTNSSSAKYTKYKTTTRVNYRTGAGTSYTIRGTLASGKQIDVENGYSKKANGYTWYRFKMNGKTYYIAAKYLKKM